jgi:hypothetical protein
MTLQILTNRNIIIICVFRQKNQMKNNEIERYFHECVYLEKVRAKRIYDSRTIKRQSSIEVTQGSV